MSKRAQNIAAGIIVAALAAFAYSLLVCTLIASMESIPVKLAAYFVLLALWFVLPLGAMLGARLPGLVAPLSRRTAMRKGLQWGAAAGLVCGIVWAAQLSMMFHDVTMMWSALSFGITMAIYAACCVSITAVKYANKS